MNSAVEMDSGAMIYKEYHKEWFRHLKVIRVKLIVHRHQGDLVRLHSFSQNMKASEQLRCPIHNNQPQNVQKTCTFRADNKT